jgi:hypothetical protein
MRRALALALLALAPAALAACESTQDKSARLATKYKGVLKHEQGISVARESKDVIVGDTAVVQDRNGIAAVVELRSKLRQAQKDLPIAIAVDDRSGKPIFKNNLPGLDHTLTHVLLIEPGQRFAWVNNQISAAGRARTVVAKVGEGAAAPASFPKIVVGAATLHEDPVDGLVAKGVVENRSQVLQSNLVIYGVARRGGKVVAAGRSIVEKVKPHAKARFSVFFIGDPRGATLELAAPPTVLK